MWATFVNHINMTFMSIGNTAGLFWDGLIAQISLLAIIDVLLVFGFLWWIYKKLRRTDLIKILPKLFLLLLIMLVARIFGLMTLFYVSGAVLVIVLLALAALYAPEIKHILEESQLIIFKDTQPTRTSTGDTQGMIKSLGEAFAVLVKAQKPALVIIKRGGSLTRLIENGTKMNSKVKSDLIIDFFANGSTLSKGAAVIDGDRIVAAGSTLLKRGGRVLFNTNNPAIKRVAKDMGGVVVITNKTIGNIAVLTKDDIYKNLSPRELTRILQTILIG